MNRGVTFAMAIMCGFELGYGYSDNNPGWMFIGGLFSALYLLTLLFTIYRQKHPAT